MGLPRINLTKQETHVVVELTDPEIACENVIKEIGESLFSLVQANLPVHMILSMTKVQQFGSIALGMLIRLNRRLEARDGSLKLCSLQPSVTDLFRLTRLDRIFEIYKDEAAAVKSLSRRP